jgi:quercetin dioxygenase-like cupin family protein
MRVFKSEEYNGLENPTPGKFYRGTILTEEHDAKDLGGIFGVLVPGSEVPIHIHHKRESIFIPISGEVILIYEGQEYTFKAGDVVYVPSEKKHGLVNKSGKEMRYIEFFTYPPVEADMVEVK